MIWAISSFNKMRLGLLKFFINNNTFSTKLKCPNRSLFHFLYSSPQKFNFVMAVVGIKTNSTNSEKYLTYFVSKKKAEKENAESKQNEVPDREARVTRRKVAKEISEDTEPVKQVKEKPVKRGKGESAEVPERKKRAVPVKKDKVEATTNEPAEVEDKKTITKRKKALSESTENKKPVPTKTKKATAVKGKRVKKTEDKDVQEDEEGPSSGGSKKPKKRAPPKKDSKNEVETGDTNSKPLKNATSTNWESINFKCSSVNSEGNTSNFHITSWNVAGLRAWLKKGCLDILQHDQPDILCIQETKCALEKLPQEVQSVDGYISLWSSGDRDGYAGVGVLTKVEPLNVIYGINSEEHDAEGRCITLEFEKFFLINVYVPNAGRKLVTLPKRMDWNKHFKEFVNNLDQQKPVILCGDMNVAHKEIDLANPKTNTKNAGFTVEEREGMTDFLKAGYVDSFRHLYPDREKAYTFWTHMANARAKNVGWRLDYFLVSQRFMDKVCDNMIHSDVLGSDHCPLSLHINL